MTEPRIASRAEWLEARQENGPHHNLMDWVKRHDEYDMRATQSSCCGHEAAE